jgi:ferric-dicitrate binding protein FerR (iron transport regulator)
MEDKKLSRLYILMANELFDRITPSEKKELQEMLATDSEAMELWDEFQAAYASDDIKDRVQEFIRQDDTEVLMKAIRHRSRLRRIGQVSAAAVFILAGGFAMKQYFFQPVTQANTPTIVAGSTMPVSGLMLQLAGGKGIDLANVTQLQEGNVTLQNDTAKRILTYSSIGEGVNQTLLSTLTVPAGLDYHIRLADGTDVFLNSGSQISFPQSFSGETREVAINGEAFLKVATDAAKPFFVHLPQGTVQVLGTSFNVNTYDSATLKVSLQDGAVAFQHGEKNTRLAPGQQVVMDRLNNDVQVKSTGLNELSWIDGKYVLDNMPLSELKVLLPRWYGVQVVFDNNNISKETVSLTLNKNKPIDHLLQWLQMALNCTYYFKDGVLHLG